MHTTCIKSRWWHRAVKLSCWFVSYFVCTAHQHSLELLDQYQFGNQSGAVAADALITKLQARLTLRHTANILWINWSSTSSSSPSSPSSLDHDRIKIQGHSSKWIEPQGSYWSLPTITSFWLSSVLMWRHSVPCRVSRKKKQKTM